MPLFLTQYAHTLDCASFLISQSTAFYDSLPPHRLMFNKARTKTACLPVFACREAGLPKPFSALKVQCF